jgi:hypothetical protein
MARKPVRKAPRKAKAATKAKGGQQHAQQILGYVPKYEDWLKIQRGEKPDDQS